MRKVKEFAIPRNFITAEEWDKCVREAAIRTYKNRTKRRNAKKAK